MKVHTWGYSTEEISRGLVNGLSLRAIATQLTRAPSTISREVSRNGGYAHYRATQADKKAWDRALRPKRCKLAQNRHLSRVIARKLKLKWSPEQIAGWRSLASFKVFCGYTPINRRFSLPAIRYLRYQYFEPAGFTSRYKPPPSKERYILSFGWAALTACAVSLFKITQNPHIGGYWSLREEVAPTYSPLFFWIWLCLTKHHKTKNRPKAACLLGSLDFMGCPEILWWWELN